MKIIFSPAGDGLVYPDFPGEAEGALAWPVVGPLGLIEILELQLGLSGPFVSETVRIAAYARKLSSASKDVIRFWDRSFAQDPWATARRILEWRDDLIAGGWLGAKTGEVRLDDLAAAETSGETMRAGRPDRLRNVMSALSAVVELEVDSIRVSAALDELPGESRRLIEALQSLGVAVEEDSARPSSSPETDLRRVQDFLAGKPVEPLTGDGTFAVIESDTALMASEAVAEWLLADDAPSQAGTVILAPAGDTGLLDHAMAARGLPALGLSPAAASRGVLQVLPLAFALAWKPFDANALLSLLNLPQPPIARFAARKLARVLIEHPGLGSPNWEAAWAEIEETLQSRAAEHDEPADRSTRLLATWRIWTEGGRHDRTVGMTRTEARDVANRVATWALETDRGEGDPLLLALAAASTTFSDAIDALGLDTLPALLVERVLGQTLASGASNPRHLAHAGTLRSIKSPSALWNTADRLIWWPFIGPGDRLPHQPWSLSELRALADTGVELEATSRVASRISKGYADAILRSRSQVVLVQPALSGDEATVPHPLAHQLEPLLRATEAKISWRAEDLMEMPAVSGGQRTIRRSPVDILDTPYAVSAWSLPAGTVDRLKDRQESATSLGHMVECQLRWVIEDILQLRSGRSFRIPGPDQLFGTLAHEITRAVLQPGAVPEPETVRTRAGEAFDALLPMIAAPLERPEHASELASARVRVPAALAELARLLRDRGLKIVGAEVERTGRHGADFDLHGRLDLVVETASGEAGVIDLKWTKSAKRYRAEIEEGRAVQLAVYSAIADEPDSARAPAAYYLLNQRLLLAEKGSPLAADGLDVVRSLPDTFDAVAEAWSAWRDLTRTGVGLAMGVEAAHSDAPRGLQFGPVDKPCTYLSLIHI